MSLTRRPGRSSRRSRSLRLTGTVVAIATTGIVGLTASPAGALAYIASRGPYPMQGFVRNANPLYGCSTGYVNQGSMTVTAPSNFGVQVYSTTYIYRWTNGSWQQVTSGSVKPGGAWVAAGSSFTFWPKSWPTGSGYYYAYMQADFHYASGGEVGAVDLKPTLTTDWNATYRYANSDLSYCWHG